jgi:hypothetical protein
MRVQGNYNGRNYEKGKRGGPSIGMRPTGAKRCPDDGKRDGLNETRNRRRPTDEIKTY